MEITQIISQVGFPIACCVAMAWYVKYTTDNNRNDRKELEKMHQESENSIKEAIVNNTIVMRKICERLDVNETSDNE